MDKMSLVIQDCRTGQIPSQFDEEVKPSDLIIFKIQLRGEKMDNLQNISVDLFPAEQLVISTPKHP